MQNNYVIIGRLMRPHGLRGDIKCAPHTHDLLRHRKLKSVDLACADGSRKTLQVERSSLHGDIWHLKFAGYDTPEKAQELVNAEVQVAEADRIQPPPGQFYFSDLEGLTAVDENGQKVGTVLSVEELPSVNAFVIRIRGREVYAPWIDNCIGPIDLEARTVQVNLEYLGELLGDDNAH